MMTGIGTAFRIERLAYFRHGRSKPVQHIGNDMVGPDQNALGLDLRRQMPVTQMPGQPQKMMRLGGTNRQKRFRRSAHFDDTAIVQHKPVTITHGDCFSQIKQKGKAALAGHRDTSPVAGVIIKHNVVRRVIPPGAGRLHLPRPDQNATTRFCLCSAGAGITFLEHVHPAIVVTIAQSLGIVA